MRFLWAFRYNPLRERQLRTGSGNCREAISWVQTCRWQFCTQNPAGAILDKIAWFATKHEA
jgi:hypothetical protein